MSNLIISRRCNQSCSYCFAGEQPAGPQPEFLSLEAFDRCLDFLDRSGIPQVRLLGGEPTLHPQFVAFVRRAQERGKSIIVFTNGWMPPQALEALEALPPEQCSVVLNVSASSSAAAETSTGQRRQRQQEVLRRLGPKAQPGCNIYRVDVDLEFIIDLMVETGCKRSVRIGLAQPILGGENVHLPVRAYPRAGERILQFAEKAARHEIKIELDCGFVRCMFTDAAVARLEALGADLGWHCSPIIDIDTDGTAFHCFPLSEKFKTQIDFSPASQVTTADLRDGFQRKTMLYRQAGIYKECASCRYKHDQTCSGGCLANTMRRFSSEQIHLLIP